MWVDFGGDLNDFAIPTIYMQSGFVLGPWQVSNNIMCTFLGTELMM